MNKFAKKIISWQHREGRHDLPWQNTRDPYRIWLSEIMLQQTQVSAVIPYYERFLSRYPTLAALAAATLDDVMKQWAGLGYYARARNLHKAARTVRDQFAGAFPETFDEVLSLQGIGRSTAAAICAFAYGDSRPILDGNVKRVFARYFAIDGDVRERAIDAAMWTLAEELAPKHDIESYIQGQMDLGATLCTRTKPDCLRCPLRTDCTAFSQGRVHELPTPRLTKATRHRQTQMLLLLHAGEVLLERRPPTGIWGGLWCLPEASVDVDIAAFAKKTFGLVAARGQQPTALDPIEHSFTHFSLSIYPSTFQVATPPLHAAETGQMWINIEDAIEAAIPAPVKRILQALPQSALMSLRSAK